MALMSVNGAAGRVRLRGVSKTASGTVAGAKRQATVDHILTLARRSVLQNGLDLTMDQLAEVTGVSRRTLFRLFETREKLLGAAFEAGMTGYLRGLPTYTAGDPDDWLRNTCDTAHRMNSTIGPGFFELASRRNLPADLASAERRRRSDFRGAMADIAATVWRTAGGVGPPPVALVTTVAAHLSPHFTAALVVDAAHDWQAAADLAYRAISAALAAELTA
ncbi:TetR/AcrR family transcriptional regulator [Mycolicibacterium diernhoferi]|uniref:TetR/AcrR family transcriptional regulator n=1 Tax=Mycolicibacterium diernhoferi TaxID=1801 RepID=A0A2A7P113_9MYCO|nr:TetR/AcrR family transcriptional regulator [Mycolicibacterium diernhoferi]